MIQFYYNVGLVWLISCILERKYVQLVVLFFYTYQIRLRSSMTVSSFITNYTILYNNNLGSELSALLFLSISFLLKWNVYDPLLFCFQLKFLAIIVSMCCHT